MTPSEDHRGSWNVHPDPNSGPPSGNFSRPASSRSPLASLWRIVKTLIVLGAIGFGGYLLWPKAVEVWSNVRANAELDGAAGFFVHELPKEVGTEDELRRAIVVIEADKLKGHLAQKGRWFVGFGLRGNEMKIVRDDGFVAEERLFIERLVEDCRIKTVQPGSPVQKMKYPLGAFCQAVLVEGRPWWVVAAWSEDEK